MGFWAPKVHNEKKSWSVILNPLRSEFDKRRAAEKIAELFHLSYEEARELAESTPLILLDELSHPSALQIQNVFQEIRADVTLTSDALLKRRCYRAVWPETPDLSFLSSSSQEMPAPKPLEVIPAEKPVGPPAPSPIPSPAPAAAIEEEVSSSEENLKLLEKKNSELELTLEQRDRELKEFRERDTSEIQFNVQDWDERYQSLKEEYRETKMILEEKVLLKEKEFQALKEQVKELMPWQEKALQLERQNRNFTEKLDHLEAARKSLEQAARENSEAVNVWREKYQGLAQKSDRFEALYEEERKRREQNEESRHSASEMAERVRIDLETQQAEAERWRRKFQELEESQKHLEEELTRFTTEQNNEIHRLQEANHELSLQLESAQRQARDLLFRLEQQDLIDRRTRLANDLSAKETRLREFALESERLRQEIQDRELRAQTLAGEQATVEREVLEIKQAQRYLLEQSKLKEKGDKFKHHRPSSPKSLSESELGIENG